MIETRKDLKRYLIADKFALGMTGKIPIPIKDYEHSQIWKFERSLRFHEYYHNRWEKAFSLGRIYYRTMCLFWGFIQNRRGIKMGYTIPINVFAEGLRINHIGPIIVNKWARVGKFCDIHSCVNIGDNFSWDSVPQIGDNVWIGPGAKIFGKIHIGDRCVIGANAVVNKSFPEDVTIAGVPAKVIGAKGNQIIRKISDAERWD